MPRDYRTFAERMEEGDPSTLTSSSSSATPSSYRRTKNSIFVLGASLAIVASIGVAVLTYQEMEANVVDPQRQLNFLGGSKPTEETLEDAIISNNETPDNNSHPGESLVAMQFSPDEFGDLDKADLLLQGKIHAVSVRYTPQSFSHSNGGSYRNVEVEFCKLDYGLHKKEPSEVPTMTHLYRLSNHCIENLYKFDLSSIVASARAYDNQSETTTHSMEPKGFVFGESRSGATLVSNALAVAHPESTRVVSENHALSNVLNACSDLKIKHAVSDCDVTAQDLAFRDLMYLVGRTNNPLETEMYVKVSPEDSEFMSLVLNAFPNAKWTFNYRDPDVVLSKNLQRKRDGICRKARGAPSDAALAHAKKLGEEDFTKITTVEACSAHFASVRNIAVNENETRSTGRLIDYDNEIKTGTPLVDEILPEVFMVDMADNASRSRVSEQIAKKTGRRGGSGTWEGYDPDEERDNISLEVLNANKKFFHDIHISKRLTNGSSAEV